MKAEVSIPAEDAQRLRRSLIEKGRGELSGVVKIMQDGELVAEARHTMGIYIDATRTPGVRANLFQIQNMKTSALMIAGLREDALSKKIAGDQGRAIANRMSVSSPQLPTLVRARALDVEAHLQGEGQVYEQVLVMGVGFDPKPAKLSSPTQRWFGVDLRDMLRERDTRFKQAGAAAPHFTPVPGDLLGSTWDSDLLAAGFKCDVPTLVITEGISMYFPREALATMFAKLRALVRSPQSRLWLDHVTSELFEMELFDVRTFLSTMTRLGEPFITGFSNPATIAPEAWELAQTTSAAAVLNISDAVHSEYRFSLLRPCVDGARVA